MTRSKGGWASAAAAALFASTVALSLPASAANDPGTEKVSVSTGGAPGNGTSHGVDVSADGSVVAFGSAASNLIPGGTSTFDIYVRDRDAGTTELISVSTTGGSGSSTSMWPSVSADGSRVAFHSIANNLVSGDDNGNADVFVRDRATGTTTLVSRATDGTAATGRSERAEISADGRHVVFTSGATDLVPGVPAGVGQVYVHHLETGEIELVSRSSSGEPASLTASEPSISADGRYVAFRSFAQNLDDEFGYIFVRDLVAGTTSAIPTSTSVQAAGPAISGDGRHVFFHTGYVGRQVYDRQTGATTAVDIPATYATSWSRWSDDGRWLAVFIEDGLRSGTHRLWVWDRLTGAAREETRTDAGDVVAVGADSAATFGPPGISADGRIVGFWTAADGVVAGDTGGIRDVFVRDRGDLLGPNVTGVAADPASLSIGAPVTITATVDDAARGGSVVASAELRVGTGEWAAMAAADGEFDEMTEIVEGEISDGLLGGTTQVCVRGTDGQGNISEPACLDVRVDDASAPVAVTVTNVSAGGGAPFPPFARIDITPGEVAPDFNDPDYDSVGDPSLRPDVEDDGDLFATHGEEIRTGTGEAIAMVDAGFLAPTGQRVRLDLNPLAGATQLVFSIDLATGEWSGVDGNGEEFRAPQSCISAADDPDGGSVSGQVCLAISTLSLDGDLDGDGLYDSWETFGVSTDATVDVELDLPGWGATPDHKDLFVQYDVSDDAVFGESVEYGLKQVQEAFALAPVDAGGTANPDGRPGIRLWIDSPSADAALNLGAPVRDLVTTEQVCSVASEVLRHQVAGLRSQPPLGLPMGFQGGQPRECVRSRGPGRTRGQRLPRPQPRLGRQPTTAPTGRAARRSCMNWGTTSTCATAASRTRTTSPTTSRS